MSPQLDMTDRFIQAMRAAPNDPGSAAELGLSVSWDTADVKERLKHINMLSFMTGRQMVQENQQMMIKQTRRSTGRGSCSESGICQYIEFIDLRAANLCFNPIGEHSLPVRCRC